MTQAQAINVKPRNQLDRAHEVRIKLDLYYGDRAKSAKLTSFWLYLNTFGAPLSINGYGSSAHYRFVAELKEAGVL